MQFDDPQRNMFVGISEGSGFRTSFEIIDLEKVPERLSTLSGAVDIFKEKIVSQVRPLEILFLFYYYSFVLIRRVR